MLRSTLLNSTPTNNTFLLGIQTIHIEYAGEPPIAINPPWNGGFTFTKDRSGNDWVAINCQKEGGRLYFPCKDHPSDEPNEGVDMLIVRTVPGDKLSTMAACKVVSALSYFSKRSLSSLNISRSKVVAARL